MKASLIVGVLAVTAAALISDSAFAGHRHRRSCCAPQPTCCVPAPCCTSAPATPAPQPATAPQSAPAPQANANSYQSYSFEPGATVPPAPATAVIPQRIVPESSSYYDRVRSDRKALDY